MSHFKKHPIDSVADHVGVFGATLDNLIAFDSNGLPKDSGTAVSALALATHSHAINDLTDVVIVTPADNELLAYDFTTSTFINQTPTEAGLASITHNHVSGDITDFNVAVSANIDVAANTLASHSHANKALLDTYTQTELNLADSVTKKHAQNTDTSLDFGGVNPVTAATITSFIGSKAQNNGLAPLDAGGKVPTIHLPASVLGSLNYKGSWNATTNIPALANLGVGGVQGDYYVVSVAGTSSIDGVTDWKLGDWITNNGTIWEKIDNTDQVSAVNGQTGAVTLGTDDVAEGVSNLYYTEARVNANLNVASNTAAKHTHVNLPLLETYTQTEANLASAVTNSHVQNTDVALRTNKLTVDASGNTAITGEVKMKVYIQVNEPVLSADQFMAIWQDSDDNNATYLVFRRGIADQVSVELS